MENAKLKNGDKITVELEDGYKFNTTIYQYESGSSQIHIRTLCDDGESRAPGTGTDVKLLANSKACCYAMFGTVKNIRFMDGVEVMHILINGDVERVQRRESYRLEKSVRIDLKIYDLYDINKIDKSVTIMTADISEGGMGFHWPEKIEVNRFLDCGITLEKDYYLLRCRVVRCIYDAENDYYRIGLEILEKDESFKDKIRKFIFGEQAGK